VPSLETKRDNKEPIGQPFTQPLNKQKTFDFEYIKVMLNQKSTPGQTVKEVMLERNWIDQTNAIPHFTKVIKNVK
jgi:hypothetical protein